MYKDRNCDQIEAETFELFRGIKTAASSESLSLEEALGRAIAEGKNFRQWQASGRPLGNVRLFLMRNDKLLPAGKFRFIRFPVLKLFRKKVGGAGLDGSRIEIWNCDRNNMPIFPLSRIKLSDIGETRPTRIEEPLRKDLFLNLEIGREGPDVLIRAGLNNPNSAASRIRESMKQLNEAGAGAVWYWQKMIRSVVMEGALPLLLIVLSLVVIPPAMRSHKDKGQSGENNYSRSNTAPDEDQILGQKCFKHLCGDPKYLSDTDTVNGV